LDVSFLSAALGESFLAKAEEESFLAKISEESFLSSITHIIICVNKYDLPFLANKLEDPATSFF
jgi:hypothetical protein